MVLSEMDTQHPKTLFWDSLTCIYGCSDFTQHTTPIHAAVKITILLLLLLTGGWHSRCCGTPGAWHDMRTQTWDQAWWGAGSTCDADTVLSAPCAEKHRAYVEPPCLVSQGWALFGQQLFARLPSSSSLSVTGAAKGDLAAVAAKR